MAAVWFQKRQRLAEVQQAHSAHAWCLGGGSGSAAGLQHVLLCEAVL